ncbi:MAG: hypothetical protein QXL94_05405 [Candidatus Parvarchaeum sp.]
MTAITNPAIIYLGAFGPYSVSCTSNSTAYNFAQTWTMPKSGLLFVQLRGYISAGEGYFTLTRNGIPLTPSTNSSSYATSPDIYVSTTSGYFSILGTGGANIYLNKFVMQLLVNSGDVIGVQVTNSTTASTTAYITEIILAIM